ncbi:MAG: hypothetical protein A2Y20_09820 [Firmicutes bacterium GWF2_51_9]|nr:MAG: hypothetical protein A2Y20_09820 [Firmicutes bacterium GWF2_51_9]OGS58181.1 MAG: hypothetical protein A2Y19_03520 [Firmicutes bacterium GWE2_51_13]HAM63560.1 hypothetical protein [Erysipelotrichaceae bacterium]HAO60912.1 hypothetical protein [Erysipelotrichaceae bacterium]HBZ42158.1 hypothetical protein [Erysipelotrichaceae bacterium]
MSSKTKIALVISMIILTLAIGILTVEREDKSANMLIKENEGVYFSDFIRNFSGDDYPKYNDQVLFSNRVEHLAQLENESGLIVEVEPDSRVIIGSYVRTRCTVHRVISSKDEKIDVEDVIYIYEHYSASQSTIDLDSPIFPMKDDQRYIVFLNRIEAYRKGNQFNVSSSVFGVIPVRNKVEIKISPSNRDDFKPWQYKDFASSDYVIDPMTSETIKEIEDNIKQSLVDLESNSNQLPNSEYKRQLDAIVDQRMSIPFALSYESRLKEIVSDALLKYYDIKVEFED